MLTRNIGLGVKLFCLIGASGFKTAVRDDP